MKTLLLSAVAALSLATAAHAFDTTFIGSSEYTFEAEVLETKLGVEVAEGPLTITPVVVIDYTSRDSFEFRGTELNAAYQVQGNLSVYGKIELDDDFDYQEATVGVAVRF